MTLGKSFAWISLRCNHLGAVTSVKCTSLSHRNAKRINTGLNKEGCMASLRLISHCSRPCITEEVYMAASAKNLKYTPLLCLFVCFFFPRLPHLTSPSTPQWTLGSFMTPRHTPSMLSRCSTSRSQSHRQQLSRPRRYFTLLLQEMFSLPVCSAGILHVLMQEIVFSLSFKGPHMKRLSHEHL